MHYGLSHLDLHFLQKHLSWLAGMKGLIFMPCHMIVVWYYVFPCQWLSVCPSVLGFHFQTWIVFDRFYSNCAFTCISGVGGLGLLMGKFSHFLTVNLSKHQWIFTKLGICIDIVKIWFGIANGQILSILDSYLPATHPYFCFWMITWINVDWFSPNLVCALIVWRSAFGLLMGKFCQFFYRVICLSHDSGVVLLFHFFIIPSFLSFQIDSSENLDITDFKGSPVGKMNVS